MQKYIIFGAAIPTNDLFQISSVPNENENELFFAMKGAGSNFGITTEFLYRVYPHPETRPVVLFMFLQSVKDFLKLQTLSDSGHYQLAAYRIQHFKKLEASLDNYVSKQKIISVLY